MPSLVARSWRSLSATGETEIVPQARLSGPMPWVIAIMVAMTVIALAAGLALRNTAQAAAAELEGGVTVQVMEADPDARNAQAQNALTVLRELPQVASVRLVPREEVDQLIEPWLGEAGGGESASIPVPALLDARIDGKVTADAIEGIRAAVAEAAPAARVDAQSSWLKPVFDAIVSLQWLAAALVVLLSVALTAAVLLAARSALGTNRDTIEIVHLLGGTDAQIARVFQRSIGVDAAGGGLVGFALAAVVILFLGRRFAGLGAGMVDGGALGVTDWLLLALVPIVSVLLAMATARVTVLHALRKML
ncbi:cell division protein [Novosphingobium marinum]|nr:cell division protein [Novosphingobium marinum]GGC36923.1 cell division protein [Novosphingobium marinum]